MEGEEEEPSLLVIVLDADPKCWRERHVGGVHANGANGVGPKATSTSSSSTTLTTLPRLIDALLVFIDAYLLTHRGNRVCVLAAMSGGSDFLFPDLDGERSEAGDKGLRAEGALLDRVGHSIVEGLKRMHDEEAERQTSQKAGGAQQRQQLEGGSHIVQAFSKGLCYTQRLLRETTVSPRVLILQASEDTHGSYNGMMNCIFSAHRASIPVDACVLGTKDSSFLQQASFITGGIYSRPERADALLEYFLYLFLPSTKTRQYLRVPKQENVDFRAACFCHKRAVEMAYVCSVCLSIFCEPSKECPTCGTPARIRPMASTKAT